VTSFGAAIGLSFFVLQGLEFFPCFQSSKSSCQFKPLLAVAGVVQIARIACGKRANDSRDATTSTVALFGGLHSSDFPHNGSAGILPSCTRKAARHI
jgi:hypothetical protein